MTTLFECVVNDDGARVRVTAAALFVSDPDALQPEQREKQVALGAIYGASIAAGDTLVLECRDVRTVTVRFAEWALGDLRKVHRQLGKLLAKSPLQRCKNMHQDSKSEEEEDDDARASGSESAASARASASAYSTQAELRRLGIPNAALRVLDQGEGYSLCKTYPRFLAVSALSSDADLAASAAFRSRGRLPVVTWVHPSTAARLVRCSQPMCGLRQAISLGDEKVCSALMLDRVDLVAPRDEAPDKRPNFVSDVWSKLTSTSKSKNGADDDANDGAGEAADTDADADAGADAGADGQYVIVDARSHMASVGNQMLGKGSEDTNNYRGASICFMSINNIHLLRAAFHKVTRLAADTDFRGDLYRAIADTGWVAQVRSVLKASVKTAAHLGAGKGVVLHCSDGWDRTAQVVGTTQLLLDPYFRTAEGLCALVRKEFCDFGFKFRHRCLSGFDDKEFSPVFHLWVDGIWQLTLQFPTAFEFNQGFLIALLDHLSSNRLPAFLFNCEKERADASVEQLPALWPTLAADETLRNPRYKHDDGPLRPSVSTKAIRFWEAYFFRHDDTTIKCEPR